MFFLYQTMKWYLYIFTVIFCLLGGASTSLAGPTPFEAQLDSLDRKLQMCIDSGGSTDDKLKILRMMYDLSKIANDQLALEYAGQAIGLMADEHDERHMAEWTEAVADVYYEKKVYYMAMERYHEAYVTFLNQEDYVKAAYALMRVGDTYFIQNLEEVALQHFQEAEALFAKHNCIEGRAEALSKIGRVELRNYQYDKAMDVFNKSLDLAQKINDSKIIAQIYCYISEIHDMNDEYEEEENYLNLAVTKYRMAGDKFEMAKIYFRIGNMHFRNEDYDKARDNFMKASNIFQEFGAMENVTAVSNRLGRISFIERNFKVADSLGRNALRMAQDNLWLAEETNALLLISDIYNEQGRIDSAFHYLSLYTVANEQLVQAKKSESFSELQVSLSTQGKDAELAKAEQALKRNRIVYIFIVIISIVVALFIINMIQNYRKAKEMNLMLTKTNEEVNMKNEEITRQKEIVERANEEVRLRNDEIVAINESINSSINYAGRIQRAMLPDVEFLKRHFHDGFVYFHPKEVVSGDFYWFSEVKTQKPPSLFRRKGADDDEGSKIIMAVIDCTGHGVPGAFMSMLGDAFMNQIVNLQHVTDPALILQELHNLVRSTLQQETTENNDGMDAAIIMVNKASNTLHYAGAKNPLILIQDGKVEKVNGDLKSVGGIQKEDDRSFTRHDIDITTPTTIYIYSDGYQDQFGGEFGRKFMAKRFREMLVENAGLPFGEQSELLFKRFSDWRGNIIQMDDTTILGVKVS